MRSYSNHLWLAGALVLSACSGPIDSEEVAPTTFVRASLEIENGADLNGADLNGADLNTGDLSNFLVSLNYMPAKKGGAQLQDVWLNGTSFYGYKGSNIYRDAEFVGVEFRGNLGSGKTVQVRIAGMNPAPAPNEDVNLYTIEYLASDGLWRPACRNTAGQPVQALPVQGVWDYRQDVVGGGSKMDDPQRFTFACLGGAIAKCALWGYKPWRTHNGVSLANYHQACTRMVRADYCGTGKSYTVVGNRINFYDVLGIQKDDKDWYFEAEWDEGGARCIYSFNRTHSNLPCYDTRASYLCGQEIEPGFGVLMRNETPTLLGIDPTQQQ